VLLFQIHPGVFPHTVSFFTPSLFPTYRLPAGPSVREQRYLRVIGTPPLPLFRRFLSNSQSSLPGVPPTPSLSSCCGRTRSKPSLPAVESPPHPPPPRPPISITLRKPLVQCYPLSHYFYGSFLLAPSEVALSSPTQYFCPFLPETFNRPNSPFRRSTSNWGTNSSSELLPAPLF